MKSSAFYAVIGVGVVVIAIIVWGSFHTHTATVKGGSKTSVSAIASEASSTESISGLAIYTNGQYGFIVVYPGTDLVQKTFDTIYHLPGTWSVVSSPLASGTSIVEFVGYRANDTATSSAQYFEAEVRIGASSDPKETATCEEPKNGETQTANTTLNGTTWATFSFGSSNTTGYVKGVSYRTLHDGECIALEKMETGSADFSTSTSEQNYANLNQIVKTFTFARP